MGRGGAGDWRCAAPPSGTKKGRTDNARGAPSEYASEYTQTTVHICVPLYLEKIHVPWFCN